MEYIQHTLEQYGLPICSSLEPTQWMNATRLGSIPSEGLITCQPVGPDALIILSISIAVITLEKRPYPYW